MNAGTSKCTGEDARPQAVPKRRRKSRAQVAPPRKRRKHEAQRTHFHGRAFVLLTLAGAFMVSPILTLGQDRETTPERDEANAEVRSEQEGTDGEGQPAANGAADTEAQASENLATLEARVDALTTRVTASHPTWLPLLRQAQRALELAGEVGESEESQRSESSDLSRITSTPQLRARRIAEAVVRLLELRLEVAARRTALNSARAETQRLSAQWEALQSVNSRLERELEELVSTGRPDHDDGETARDE